MGVRPEHHVHIGDNMYSDVEVARTLGIAAIHFSPAPAGELRKPRLRRSTATRPARDLEPLVTGLLLLEHIYGVSDECVCERWVYYPYFQHFTGDQFFQHEFPHERPDLSHWGKRLGDKLELLLAESLRVANETGALRTRDLNRSRWTRSCSPRP
jgi:Transposase domain (DUF772)